MRNLSQLFPQTSARFGQVENRQETFMHRNGRLALHLGSNHRTSPNGAYLSLRLQQLEDYRRLQEVHPALGISPPTHGPRDRRPWHYQCSHQALPRERCRLISRDHPSLPHLPSKLHSHRASPLPLTSSWHSHLGGQQEGDCWHDLLRMDPPLPLTLSTRTEEDNRPGDGASQANRQVAPDGDEG